MREPSTCPSRPVACTVEQQQQQQQQRTQSDQRRLKHCWQVSCKSHCQQGTQHMCKQASADCKPTNTPLLQAAACRTTTSSNCVPSKVIHSLTTGDSCQHCCDQHVARTCTCDTTACQSCMWRFGLTQWRGSPKPPGPCGYKAAGRAPAAAAATGMLCTDTDTTGSTSRRRRVLCREAPPSQQKEQKMSYTLTCTCDTTACQSCMWRLGLTQWRGSPPLPPKPLRAAAQ
jgi:hypothetical protein